MPVSVTAFDRWPTCVLCCGLTDRARVPDPVRMACCIAMGSRNPGLLRVTFCRNRTLDRGSFLGLFLPHEPTLSDVLRCSAALVYQGAEPAAFNKDMPSGRASGVGGLTL